ncbi:MAG: UDP-N-acetylmuramate dehydrogenase [Candidatus Peregrinibacteria bacterium]
MQIQENVPLKAKTTMRIGGTARFFIDVRNKPELEEAVQFARAKNLPIVVLGGGSNTVFADGVIEAVVLHLNAASTMISGGIVTVQAGKILASLVMELSRGGLDLSALAGIPGTVGGALFGNAGQGPQGTWIDSFVKKVTVFSDGQWRTMPKEECGFGYRESSFKSGKWKTSGEPGRTMESGKLLDTIIWEAVLDIPLRDPVEIQAEVAHVLKRRTETQIAVKTAGSCFKAFDNVPAWQIIDGVGLKGFAVGDVCISDKHANFLVNKNEGTFIDLVTLIDAVRTTTGKPLEVEMRLIDEEGQVIG